MKSMPIRAKDHLLSPSNAALLLIDFQPVQFATIESMHRGELVNNVVALAKTAQLYKLPIILSTVNVSTGVNPDTITQIRTALKGITSIDRTNINAWEDEEFNAAVVATGRKKLIIAALAEKRAYYSPHLIIKRGL